MLRSIIFRRSSIVITGCIALLISGCILPDMLIALLKSAQNSISTSTETIKIYPTRTALPWPTFTPWPSSTPDNRIYRPLLEDTRQMVPEGFFSFLPLKNYELTGDANYVNLDNYTDGIFIHMEGFYSYEFINEKPKDIAEIVIQSFNDENEGTLWLTDEMEQVRVDNTDGMVFNTVGELNNFRFDGAVFVFSLDKHQFVIGVSLACTENEYYLWEQKGEPDFEMVMNSLQFIRDSNPNFEG